MTSIKIYGVKGMVIAKPFQINSADDEPEAIAEEEQIINSDSVSEPDKTESAEVGEQSGN